MESVCETVSRTSPQYVGPPREQANALGLVLRWETTQQRYRGREVSRSLKVAAVTVLCERDDEPLQTHCSRTRLRKWVGKVGQKVGVGARFQRELVGEPVVCHEHFQSFQRSF